MAASLLDRAIAYVAPRAAVNRAAARTHLEMMYDGAARSHRTSSKRIYPTSANTEAALSLPRLRDVLRDFGRNNPTAANIHAAIPASVVGAGIIPSVQSDSKRLKQQLQGLIRAHLDTTAIDFDGRGNLYALQNLVMRCVVESGDALIVRYVPPARLRLPVPLQVRVLEADYLDHFRNGPVDGGNVCFQGIEFDRDGRRVAYWLYDEHPGGGITWRMPRSSRVVAADVIHVFRQDRPGQYRGIPWGAAAVMTLWDSGEVEDAVVMQQKIAACFGVIWTGVEPGGLAQSVTGHVTPAGNALESLEPGLVQRLPPGADVKTITPPMPQGYRDFTVFNGSKVCRAYGVPYEVGTGDMSQVSFISGRLGRIQFNVNVDQWRWHMLIPHMCTGIGKWFLDASAIPLGRPTTGVALNWTPPRREMVSPKDEIPPMREATRAGFITRSENTRSLGFDPEVVEKEFAEENKRSDADNLRFDSDGRFPINTRGTEVIVPPDGAEDTGAAPPPAPPAKGNKGK